MTITMNCEKCHKIIVCDGDGKPVYSGLGGNSHITSASSFDEWYRDRPGINHSTASKLALWDNGRGGNVNRYGANGEQWQATITADWCGTVGYEAKDPNGNPQPCTFAYGQTVCDTDAVLGYTLLACASDGKSYSATLAIKLDGNPFFFPVDDDLFTPMSERSIATIPVYYDPARIWERFELRPDQMIDYKALKGDPTDNIPGIPGVGEKTAAKLVGEFGSLEGIYARLGEVTPEKLRDKLVNLASYEMLYQTKRLRGRLLFELLRLGRFSDGQPWPEWLPSLTVREIYLSAARHYKPHPSERVHAVVFSATEHGGDEAPFRDLLVDPDLGWRALLGDRVTIVDAPGGHSNILQQPHVAVVAPYFCAAFSDQGLPHSRSVRRGSSLRSSR